MFFIEMEGIRNFEEVLSFKSDRDGEDSRVGRRITVQSEILGKVTREMK